MKNLLFFIAILLFSFQAVVAQEKVYMPFFEVINMNKNYQYSTSRLLKLYLEQENKYELVLPVKDSSNYNETKEQALLKAKELKINHVLIGELNRIGESVIVSVTMMKTENGEKEWTAVQKAKDPEDLEPIMKKIARGMSGKIAIAQTNDIYNVTDNESKELNKITATKYFGIEIGGGTTSLNVDNNNPAGFSLVWSGDLRTLLYDVKGSLYFSDVNIYNMSIHIYYPFSSKNSTPFLGGGLGYGGTSVPNKEANIYAYMDERKRGSGLTMYFGGGMIFNRTSTVSLRLNCNLFYSLYTVNGEAPAGLLIGLSVLF